MMIGPWTKASSFIEQFIMAQMNFLDNVSDLYKTEAASIFCNGLGFNFL